jgi:PleD family two-component response regulator
MAVDSKWSAPGGLDRPDVDATKISGLPGNSGAAMTVLVVDDDEGSLLVAKAAVEKSGHRCIVAADGDTAWQLYLERRPQVVVSDLMMPGLDGFACAGRSGPPKQAPRNRARQGRLQST